MKAKTIQRILNKKFYTFVNSIKDEKVKELVRKNTIITGGCIVSYLLGEKPNDFDLYFRDEETTYEVAKYYVKLFKKENPPMKFRNGHSVELKVLKEEIENEKSRIKVIAQSSGVASADQGESEYQYFENTDVGDPSTEEFIEVTTRTMKTKHKCEKNESKPKYMPVFMTTNAITLTDKVQLIIRFYGSPFEIHENYDYVHCTNYWTSWDRELCLQKKALESILTRELVYVGSKYPLASLVRARKFIKKGWSINAGQFLKMAFQLNDLDLHDIKVLEDQLVGVDIAYFHELLSALENSGKPIEYTYIAELVDRIF